MISKAPTSVVAVIDAGERVAPNEVLGELLKEKELDLRRDLVLFFYFLIFFCLVVNAVGNTLRAK